MGAACSTYTTAKKWADGYDGYSADKNPHNPGIDPKWIHALQGSKHVLVLLNAISSIHAIFKPCL